MADNTHIEWADATWNIVTGCSVVSPGCTNCYAMRLAGTRLQHLPSRAGLTQDSKAGPVWTGEVRFNEQWLDQPLRWRQPRRIFVCAHGDLFHEAVPDEWIDRVFAVMALCPQHQFLVLSKRAGRMREYVSQDRMGYIEGRAKGILRERSGNPDKPVMVGKTLAGTWPWPHVWLGVSVEDQPRADERIPELLATPAAVRFISAEPLMGPIDLRNLVIQRRYGTGLLDAFTLDFKDHYGQVLAGPPKGRGPLDWVIAGGESGPGARPMHPDWARSLRDQCSGAGVPFFFKQWGEWIDADCWLDGLSYTPTINREPWRPHRPLNYSDAAWLAEATGRAGRYQHHSDGSTLIRVGKRAAGRLLDGREHSEFPTGLVLEPTDIGIRPVPLRVPLAAMARIGE